MDNTRPDTDPLNGNNPDPAGGTPPPDADPGITPAAASMVTGFGDLWDGILAIPGGLRRAWAWANNTLARRRANAALAIVLLFALVVIGLTGGKDVPTPPPVVTGLHREVVETDENLASIGKPYGVSRQEMIDANIDGVVAKYTNEVCPKLERPPTYFDGFLVDGETRRDGTYCYFSEYRGNNPAYIGKKLAQDSVRPKDDVLVPCTEKSTPLIPECQTQVVAQNVN